MSLINWMIFGSLAGLIISVVDRHPSGGVLGAMMLGISGAIVGGLIGNIVFGMDVSGLYNPSFAIAAVSSTILLAVSRTLRRL